MTEFPRNCVRVPVLANPSPRESGILVGVSWKVIVLTLSLMRFSVVEPLNFISFRCGEW